MATVQNTLIVIDDNTISTSIKPALVAELREVSKATGKSLSWCLNRAVDLWLEIEAPVVEQRTERA